MEVEMALKMGVVEDAQAERNKTCNKLGRK